MTYLDVVWLHTNDRQPVRIVSELDADRLEVRKLEFFRTRGVGYAEADFAFGSTELDPAPLPGLDWTRSMPIRSAMARKSVRGSLMCCGDGMLAYDPHRWINLRKRCGD